MSLSIFFYKKNLWHITKSKVKSYIFNKNSFSGPEILITNLIKGLTKKKLNLN